MNFNVHTRDELLKAWPKVQPGDTVTLFVDRRYDYDFDADMRQKGLADQHNNAAFESVRQFPPAGERDYGS